MTSLYSETTVTRMILPKLIDLKEELTPSSVATLMFSAWQHLAALPDGRVPFERVWTSWLHDNAQDIFISGVSYILGKDEVTSASRILEDTIEILDERLDNEGVEYGN
jgi:hypothetical protein